MQHIQGAPHIGRRPFLARMGDKVQAVCVRQGKHVFEFFRWVAHFAGIQTHANEFVFERQSLIEGLQGGFFAQVAQEAQDELRTHAQLRLRIRTRAVQAVDDGGHGHAALGVGLWVKEDFCMHHVVSFGALQISPSHVVKILLVQQHARACVVDVEEALQVGEGIGRTQGFYIRIRQLHTIALGQRKDEFRL